MADMGSILGKRRSRGPDTMADDAQAILRRHFEAQFAPLRQRPVARAVEIAAPGDDESEEDSRSESEWGGISDEEEGSTEVNTTVIRDPTD